MHTSAVVSSRLNMFTLSMLSEKGYGLVITPVAQLPVRSVTKLTREPLDQRVEAATQPTRTLFMYKRRPFVEIHVSTM